MKQLLYRPPWNPDDGRDDLRDCVVNHLGDDDAVLVVDATGLLKKGVQSAGVARQYSGAAGRSDHRQVGAFPSYADRRGAAFVDRRLYLPERWTDDRARRRAVGVPDAEPFATKPHLALVTRQDAVAASAPFRWGTGDSVYGDFRAIRLCPEKLSPKAM